MRREPSSAACSDTNPGSSTQVGTRLNGESKDHLTLTRETYQQNTVPLAESTAASRGLSSIPSPSEVGQVIRSPSEKPPFGLQNDMDILPLAFARVFPAHGGGAVLDSMRSEFGTRGENTWLSPLLPMYWFFELQGVASSHLFLSAIQDTNSEWDVSLIIEGIRKTLTLQPSASISI